MIKRKSTAGQIAQAAFDAWMRQQGSRQRKFPKTGFDTSRPGLWTVIAKATEEHLRDTYGLALTEDGGHIHFTPDHVVEATRDRAGDCCLIVLHRICSGLSNGKPCLHIAEVNSDRCLSHQGQPPRDATSDDAEPLRKPTSGNAAGSRNVALAELIVNAINAEYATTGTDPSNYSGLPWHEQGISGRRFWAAVALRVRQQQSGEGA